MARALSVQKYIKMWSDTMSTAISYESFEAQWLSDISDNETLSAVEKGRRFALKLVSQWLDFSDDEPEDFFIGKRRCSI